jgi:hypothetical protein
MCISVVGRAPSTAARVGSSTTRRFVAMLGIALGVACGGASPSQPAVSHALSGTWAGYVDGGGPGLSVTLLNVNADILGSGTLFPGIDLSITGTFISPNVTATLASARYSPVTLTGTLASPTKISASLTGGGFKGESVTLTKQPQP